LFWIQVLMWVGTIARRLQKMPRFLGLRRRWDT